MSGAIEIKDRNSNVRMTMNSQGAVFVDNITGQTLDIATPTPISAVIASNPSITGAYSFGVADVAGIVAATNHLALFNPLGSGKNIYPTSALASNYQVGDASTAVLSMRIFRITASSGGTLATTAEINKFNTAYPNSIAEVRYGSVTATLGASVFTTPPPIGAGKGSVAGAQSAVIPSSSPPIVLAPGEGLVYRCAVGDVDQRWNLGFSWAEI